MNTVPKGTFGFPSCFFMNASARALFTNLRSSSEGEPAVEGHGDVGEKRTRGGGRAGCGGWGVGGEGRLELGEGGVFR